jgi:uncharacterized membrane protein
MNFLLPHRFKKIGVIIAPLGFILWLFMQMGYFTRVLIFIFGENSFNQNNLPYNAVNIIIAVISFFSFLGGIYFVSFSKEKVEDEMVERTRLVSFQIAAVVQMIFIVFGFLSWLIFKEPNEEGQMLFFISAICLFWILFIGRFNYILHIKIK